MYLRVIPIQAKSGQQWHCSIQFKPIQVLVILSFDFTGVACGDVEFFPEFTK
jgi:hypothetical protein